MAAGWLLALSALVLLKPLAPRTGFVAAGVAVQALGLVLAVRAHLPERRSENHG